MSTNLGPILDKLENEHAEINMRSMQNLLTKIDNKLIQIELISENECVKFLMGFSKWLFFFLANSDNINYDFNFVNKVLETFNTAITKFPSSSIKKLKQEFNISALLSDIYSKYPNFMEICELIQQNLAKFTLAQMPGMNENNFNLNNTNEINPNQSSFNNNKTIPMNNFNFTNNINAYNNTVTIDSNAMSSFPIFTNTIQNNNENQTITSKNNTKVSAKNTTKLGQNENSDISSFPKPILPKQEEQFIFDIGINLKYGDALQIYYSFNLIYNQILNDIPIEYILECDEFLKSFFGIFENCSFLELGPISYKILDKMITLVDKKLSLYINQNNNTLFGKGENNDNGNGISNNKDDILILTEKLNNVESFLYFSMNSLIIAINSDEKKLSFYLPLLEKNYILLNRVISSYENYFEILYKILNNFDIVVSNYKTKNLSVDSYFIFLLKIYANFDDNILVELIETPTEEFNGEQDIISFLHNLFFTVCSSPNKQIQILCQNLIQKFENLKEDSEKIRKFLNDYENAKLIAKSLEITQDMLNGKSETNLIIDNFLNILLSLRFLSNQAGGDEYDRLFGNNENDSSPLIIAICDFYIQNTEENLSKSVELLYKLLSFKSSNRIENTKLLYNSIINELSIYGKDIHGLFNNIQILSVLYNDLSNENYRDLILEILFVLFKDLNINNPNNYEMKKLFMLIPNFPKNFKFSSLQNKLESNLSFDEILIKYLRLLFSKNENLRFNAIRFFNNPNNIINNSTNQNSTESDLKVLNNILSMEMASENNMKKNYSEFKENDTLLLIETAKVELYRTISDISEEKNINLSRTNEFLPLLNILVSNKIDYNIKTSAIGQMIMMIKNEGYKKYFLGDILNYILKEVDNLSENELKSATYTNYLAGLIKLLDIILFVYLNEEKVYNILVNNNERILHNMIKLSLLKQENNNAHLMSSFALAFIFMQVFYYYNPYNNFNKVKTNQINTIENEVFNDEFPILKLFNDYYHINIIPNKLIQNFSNENEESLSTTTSILNFSITRNIIDYIRYYRNPLVKIYDFSQIKYNITKIKNLNILDILINVCKLFSYYLLYFDREFNDLIKSDILGNVVFFLKKLYPSTKENRNLIMDLLSFFDLFLKNNNVMINNNENMISSFQSILSGLFNYVSINKEFISGLAESVEDQNFVFGIMSFIIDNKEFFPFSVKSLNSQILGKFLEIYNNILVFDNQDNFYPIKVALIKFECIFLPRILSLNIPEKTLEDQFNSIMFFMTKYEVNSDLFSRRNYCYLIWCLKYILLLLHHNILVPEIQLKSYVFIKLLKCPNSEINILNLNIIALIFDVSLFEKNGTIITEIFEKIKNCKDRNLRLNFINFVIKSLEFFLNNKRIDGECEENIEVQEGEEKGKINYSSPMLISELIAINEKVYDQTEVIDILNTVLNTDYDSMTMAMLLKLVNTCLNVNIENREYAYSLFFDFAFYDFIGEIIGKEKKNISDLEKVNLNFNATLFISTSDYSKDIRKIQYTNKQRKMNTLISQTIESVLNIKECLDLLIRSFYLLKSDEKSKELSEKYMSHISDIYENLLDYSEVIVKIWEKFDIEQYSKENKKEDNVKVLQSYTLKYFSFLNTVLDDGIINKNDKPFEDTIERFSNVCFNLMKYDSSSSFDVRYLYSKILPYLIENSKGAENLKNEKEILKQLMLCLKSAYNIKSDLYSQSGKSNFKINEENTPIKDDIVNSISSLLLKSQECKRYFVSESFVDTFVDYAYQLDKFLVSIRMNTGEEGFSPAGSLYNSGKKIPSTSNSLNTPNSLAGSRRPQLYLQKYAIQEFEKVLIIFQCLFYDFEKCNEREQIFSRIYKSNTDKCDIVKSRFLEMIYSIFFNISGYQVLFENYLKMMMNIIANGDEVNKLLLISNTEASLNSYYNVNSSNQSYNPNTSSKSAENLISLFTNHFLSNYNILSNNPNFSLYVKFIQCLCQYKPISNKLLKTKFTEELKNIIKGIILNKKLFNKNIKLLGSIVDILITLAINEEHAKKIGKKEFVCLLNEVLLKSKNETVLYSIIFLFRNLCFTNSCKNLFMSEQSLMGTIFALFTQSELSLKLRYILSCLVWVLLYNNQSLKTSLSKEDFKSELVSLQLHIQKDLDTIKFGIDNEHIEEEKKEEEIDENGKGILIYNDKDKAILEKLHENMTKIMHIING